MTFEQLKEELDSYLDAVREMSHEPEWPWFYKTNVVDGFVRTSLQALELTADEPIIRQLVDFYETQFGFEKMASPRIIPHNT